MREVERRYIAAPVEFRATGNGPGQLFGYAAKYNTLSQNLGGFVETIAPGAFDKSIGDNLRVLCRGDHHDTRLLGTTEAGTLRVSTDDTGLPYDVDLPATDIGTYYGVMTQRGDIRYSSFAFICIEDEWGITEQGFPLRTLTQVQLIDVAPVANPAYLDTSVAKRSLAERLEIDVEELSAKGVEEVRSLILGETPTEDLIPSTPEARTQEPDGEGQGETHPLAVTVQQAHLALYKQLDDLK